MTHNYFKGMSNRDRETPAEGVAIIGMSCMFPGAPDVDTFWRNILGKVDAVTDPPAEAWDSDVYYDPSFTDKDKVYCRRGGYLGSLVSFDPLEHGIPPVVVGGEPDQWLALQLAHDAMADAGCLELPEHIRRRTEVILGKGTYLNGGNAIAIQHGLIVGQTIEIIRKMNPDFSEDQIRQLREAMKQTLPPMSAETVPGLVPNIIVGRIANRMDLMGPAYTVDGACASSLVAVQHAMRDLLIGDCDLALVGGAQVLLPVPTLNIFCQLGALSRRQQIRPFDQDADGTLLGEGIGMVVLKRLSDAERDGNRIYAVIRGAGMSSDGRGVSVMAPRVDGEELALRRSYESSGISPSTIGLIEAHGTATPVGDVVEVQALTRVFGERRNEFPPCAIGTVKSMISHTIPASGIAGLIKTALALHHKVLPPTINCDTPNPKLELEKTPFYVNTEVRPWIHGGTEPRRAGINAFGFGGINAHVIVEEYFAPAPISDGETARLPGHLPAWESEVFIFEGQTPVDIVSEIDHLASFLDRTGNEAALSSFDLADLSRSVNSRLGNVDQPLRLAIIATDLLDLKNKLSRSKAKLSEATCKRIKEVSGIYYNSKPLARVGKTALLFPGEGSQYTNMLADLCLHFPEVRASFDRSDRIYRDHPRDTVLSDVVFPRPSFTDAERQGSERRLTRMDMAIEAVLTANHALHKILTGLDLEPDAIAGHSTGEFSAMVAAGALNLDTDEQVAAFILGLYGFYQDGGSDDGVPRAMMLAIGAERERAEAIVQEAGGNVFLAMENCPHQSVLVGERIAVERAREITKREQLIFEELSFDRAYHTKMFGPYAEQLKSVVREVDVRAARTPLYSCTTASEYPADVEKVRHLMVEHWSSPVEFRRTIEALYDSGVRVFVESGPRGNLTAFVEDILRGREFIAIPANVMRRSGITQLNHLVGLLASHGARLNWGYLYRNRPTRLFDLDANVERFDEAHTDRRLALWTSWPMLKISDEVMQNLHLRAGSSAELLSPTEDDSAESVAGDSQQQPAGTVSNDGGYDETVPLPADYEADFSEPSFSTSDAGRPSSAAPGILQPYFDTMEDFLMTQEEVMHAFLADDVDWSGVRGHHRDAWDESAMVTWHGGQVNEESTKDFPRANGLEPPDHVTVTEKPLLGRIVAYVPGVRLIARRVFNRDEDLYLDDHTLGHSLARNRQEALAIMPLTMSLEILAEAAAALAPDKTVVGMRDVQALRWLSFGEQPQEFEVAAVNVTSDTGFDQIRATLTNVSEKHGNDDQQSSPAVEAIVELSNAYPARPTPIDPIEGSPSRRTSEMLYRTVMFHGPMWQGVETMDILGSTGAEATLRVLPAGEFFRSIDCPTFEIDPITLDAAGQVVGFWTSELLTSGKVVFPYRIDRIDIYGRPPASGTRLHCRAAIQLIGTHLTSSNIDVAGTDGLLWMRLTGWQDKRFDLPEQFEPLMLPQGPHDISIVWAAPMSFYGGSGAIECRQVLASINADRPLWSQIWSEAVLDREERQEFRALRTPETRQLEWLAARTAAKDAVRSLARAHFGVDLAPNEIHIYHDGFGAPRVHCPAFTDSGFIPVVSLAHTGGRAAAIAGFVAEFGGEPAAGIGIDFEQMKPLPDGFVETAFDESERAVFEAIGIAHTDEWLLRAWCAKEAIAKALGWGLIHGPRSLQIVSIEPRHGTVSARTLGKLASESSRSLLANTGRDDDLIFATAACELHPGARQHADSDYEG